MLIEIKVEDMAEMIKADTEENYMEIVQRNAKDMITYYGVNNFYTYTAYELKEKYQNCMICQKQREKYCSVKKMCLY